MKRGNVEPNQYGTCKVPKVSKEKSNSSLNRDPVHVFCRLKPLQTDPETSCVKQLSPTTLTLAKDHKSRKECNYIFKHVFNAFTTQRDVFEAVALPLLEDLINGKNGLLFTYGVTGSGKTFTLTGDQTNPGVVPRCIDTLFNTIGECLIKTKYLIKPDKLNSFEVQFENDAIEEKFLRLRSTKQTRTLKSNKTKPFYIEDSIRIQNFSIENRYAVFVSYTEIYNNAVFDLLDETSGRALQTKLIRSDASKNMYVHGVVEIEVQSAEEAYELFYLGQKRKRMGHTALNSESSRSHSIFNIRVVQIDNSLLNKPNTPENTLLKVSQLSLVDLAGSERCNRTQNTGTRLKEASMINNSLMTLRSCMDILRENQLTGANKLVRYRDSRLTFLFKNYFDGDGQVRMIVCLNPSMQDMEENLQVLKFAEVTQEVKVTKSKARFLTPCAKTPKSTRSAHSRSTPRHIREPLFPVITPFKPKLSLDNCMENDLIFEKILKVITARKQREEECNNNLRKIENNFRKRLLRLQDEHILGKSESASMRAMLRKQKNANNNLENKITNLEAQNNSLLVKNDEYQETIVHLNNRIEEKNLRINQNALESAKAKKVLASPSAIRQEFEKATIVTEETGRSQFRHTPRPNRHRRSRSVGEVYLEHNAVKPVPLNTVLKFAEVTQEVKVTKSKARFLTPCAKTPKSTRSAHSRSTPRHIREPLFPVITPFKPKLSLDNCMENDLIFEKILKVITARKQREEECNNNLRKNENNFRKLLLRVQDEHILGKSECASMRAMLRKRKNANNNLENKITNLEAQNNSLLVKNDEYQETIVHLNNRIEEKNLRINQNALESAKAKKVLASPSAIRQEFEKATIATEETGRSQFRHTPRPNRHRRSRSVGEVYLEHNAVKPVSLNTVLQSCMKKRKSVTKLDKAKNRVKMG